ncbi:hypothetical protein B0H16DRAFT_1550347 [Mycena metata]|uniref:Uncharacterized protein n=1 Tax=Mycena metata TaxID=1033252 RepID=A0AAD7N8D4_9AGAR|nr:hypothetical protein B0H16DRAFT_1550347 [Mycena metata]
MIFSFSSFIGRSVTCQQTTQYLRAVSYINSIQSIDTPYNVWIRRSSGLLCLGISPRYPEHLWFPGEEILGELLPNTSITDQEVMVTHHLSLRQYHDCCRALSLVRHESISTSATVTLAALMQWPMQDRFKTSHDLICIQDVEAIDVKWKIFYLPGNIDIMANGSIRFKAAEVSKQRFGLYFPTPEDVRLSISMWLSQANHIFHRLQIFGNYTDYVMLHNVHFEIKISPAAEAPLSGYLFLCPPSAFRAGSSSFRWPEYPAYWSSDPLGVERLTTEEATDLGFPLIQLTTEVRGYSWDAGVYTGLRQFHTAKGFDPDSQDVALHLGYPLYKLPNEMETDVPFAHIVDDDPLTGVSVENVLLSEVILESTDSSNLFEPSMSRGFEVISSIQVVLILFLVLSQVYETVG